MQFPVPLQQARACAVSVDSIAVLRRTAERLQALKSVPDSADAQQLSELLLDDPMMCLRLLADVAALRPGQSNIETITGAILMLGVEPFLRRYADLPILEDGLTSDSGALHEFRRLHRRALRSARFAGAFSVARNDPDIGLIYVAAMMGSVDRLILCSTQPAAAIALADERCDAAQPAALMTSLGLPVHLTDLVASCPDRIDVQMHRIRLAREFSWVLESGWSHPTMPALLDELAALLGITLVSAREVVEQVAA